MRVRQVEVKVDLMQAFEGLPAWYAGTIEVYTAEVASREDVAGFIAKRVMQSSKVYVVTKCCVEETKVVGVYRRSNHADAAAVRAEQCDGVTYIEEHEVK